MVFVGEGTTLKPGSVGIKLLCPVSYTSFSLSPINLMSQQSSTSGPFLLEKSEIRLSKVLLQWNHKQKQSHSRLVKEIPTVIHVPKDPQAVDVFINQPQSSTHSSHVVKLSLTPEFSWAGSTTESSRHGLNRSKWDLSYETSIFFPSRNQIRLHCNQVYRQRRRIQWISRGCYHVAESGERNLHLVFIASLGRSFF